MKLISKTSSKVDKTQKYIFELESNLIIEFSYIDNGSGKDIICVPCQSMCNMKCTFCHLTDHIGKVKLRNLTKFEILEGVEYIVNDMVLTEAKPLLISYMGCGEPLANIGTITDTMILLMSERTNIRFGLATMLPKSKWKELLILADHVKEQKIPLKVHLSLHFTDDETRLKWMPSALNIKSSIDLLNFYKSYTGNPIEVHYTIMDGVNDNNSNMYLLESLIEIGTTIKFMRYSEKDSIDVKGTSINRVKTMEEYLDSTGHTTEYYEPPGMDIGASCGQFLTDTASEPKDYFEDFKDLTFFRPKTN